MCCVFPPCLGFPGYGYLPTPTPGAAATDRHISAAAAAAAAAAYYADYAAAAPTAAHVTSHVASQVARSEASPMTISSSPLHRDQYSQRAAAAGSYQNCKPIYTKLLYLRPTPFTIQCYRKNYFLKSYNFPFGHM